MNEMNEMKEMNEMNKMTEMLIFLPTYMLLYRLLI